MNVDQVLHALREYCPPDRMAVRTAPIDETYVTLPAVHLRTAVRLLVERFRVTHLSTISGQDRDGEIELLYHFWDRHGLTLRVVVPRARAQVDTLIDLIPGAAFYEREIAEMLHVAFIGHPDPAPLLLPDDWGGEPPLRRDFASGADLANGAEDQKEAQ